MYVTVHPLAAGNIDAQVLNWMCQTLAHISVVSLVDLLLSHNVSSLLSVRWLLLRVCVWTVGWMSFPSARTPWAPSRRRTLTAWRSSSSTMTSTTAGTWQQRLTGIMRTVQHASSSAHASRLLQVFYTSDLTNVHACMLSTVGVWWWQIERCWFSSMLILKMVSSVVVLDYLKGFSNIAHFQDSLQCSLIFNRNTSLLGTPLIKSPFVTGCGNNLY